MKQRVFRGGRVLVLALFYLSALSNHVDAAVNPTDGKHFSDFPASPSSVTGIQ